MKVNRRWLVTLVLLCLPLVCAADETPLRLAGLFGHGSVMQRDTKVPVWGWGTPRATVEITVGDSTAKTRIARDGAWKTEIQAPPAGGPYALTVTSGDEQIRFLDVLVGEVWICSGQSNME